MKTSLFMSSGERNIYKSLLHISHLPSFFTATAFLRTKHIFTQRLQVLKTILLKESKCISPRSPASSPSPSLLSQSLLQTPTQSLSQPPLQLLPSRLAPFGSGGVQERTVTAIVRRIPTGQEILIPLRPEHSSGLSQHGARISVRILVERSARITGRIRRTSARRMLISE
jgi:hypothetical protein